MSFGMLIRWFGLAVLLVGCAALPPPAPATPTSQPSTRWGIPETLASARSFNSPALVARDSGFVTAAFVPDGDSGLSRLTLFNDGQQLKSSVTALNPFGLTLTRVTNSAMLALWRSLKPDNSNTTELHSALVRLDSGIELGVIPVSSQPVVRFDSLGLEDSSVWVVWSGSPVPESVLFFSRVDSSGRPRIAQQIITGADYPTLSRALDGQVSLYWIRSADGAVWRAVLSAEGTLGNAQRIASSPPLSAGDLLDGLHVGQDDTSVYLFWEILTAEGQRVTWFQVNAQDGQSLSEPQMLRVVIGEGIDVSTGFNHVQANSASLDAQGLPVSRVSPADGRGASLPVAVEMGGSVGVLYFANGQIIGVQVMAETSLIAAPVIAADGQRDLALAWWDAQPDTATLTLLYSAR